MKTFIFFTSTKHCPACATMKANMEKAGIEYDEVDTDTKEGARLTTIYNVQSIPTLAVKIDGILRDTYYGALPVSKLKKIK